MSARRPFRHLVRGDTGPDDGVTVTICGHSRRGVKLDDLPMSDVNICGTCVAVVLDEYRDTMDRLATISDALSRPGPAHPDHIYKRDDKATS